MDKPALLKFVSDFVDEVEKQGSELQEGVSTLFHGCGDALIAAGNHLKSLAEKDKKSDGSDQTPPTA